MTIPVRIKTINGAQAPKYETTGACGFDIAANEDTTIAAKSVGLIKTGLIVQVPKGYALLVGSRSSTAKKFGLLTPHGFGLLDQDYHGDTDELLLQFYNFTDEPVTIERGVRVGQGFFTRVDQASFEVVTTSLKKESRGGFGSTGH
jgi:dUTP pyrophosphatase